MESSNSEKFMSKTNNLEYYFFTLIRGGGKDTIEENNLGVCANPNDIDDIAKGFNLCVDFAKEHTNEVRTASQELMRTRFNKEMIVRRFTEVLEKSKRK